jgi:hypothetical protein
MTKHQRRTVHGGTGIFACALALAVAGCGGGGGANVQIGAQSSVTLANHLTLSLSEDKQNAATGEKVTYQITLTNPTAASITSTYLGYPSTGPVTLDELLPAYTGTVQVEDSTGAFILSDGSRITAIPPTPPTQPITVTIPPGQSLSAMEVYTFTRADVYTTTVALQNQDRRTLTPAAGPLTVFIQ